MMEKETEQKNILPEIYRNFEKKYCLGELAVLEACCIASLKAKNIKPFSVIVISPSGGMKSHVMADIAKCFNSSTYTISSRFTPYGISGMKDKHILNNKTWLVNDMVRTLDTLSTTKVLELVGWLAELMSEYKAGSETAKEAFIEAKMNLLANIALIKYKDVKNYFISSTFAERLVQFFYSVPKEKVRKISKPKLDITNIYHIKETDVAIQNSLKQKIYSISDRLQELQQYEKESLRPDEIVKSMLAGHCILRGKKKVSWQDIQWIENLMETGYLKRVI